MKVDGNHPAAQAAWAAYASKAKWLLLIVLLSLPAGKPKAQCVWNNVFYDGEQITYDLYFKWGILMPKAGLAHFSVKDTPYNNHKAWEYKLMFNTAGMFEKIFKMRDTLTTYFSPEAKLLFSSKRTEEGGYYLADEMTFSPVAGKTAVHSCRYGRTGGAKIDTTLLIEGCVYDMLATAMYLRSIDWTTLKAKDEFPFRVVVGRDVVNVRYRYTGQAIVAPDERVKYRTHHFFIDVYDPAFEQSREAAEVWVGDDENRIPIRVRAKLKIGAAEVYFKEAEKLKHPFSSRIFITKIQR
ncbi:MAG: DUF3108 domain-containing protein [Tannerellaceae bacterium]|jgi:hypothetical protein|nr:DUF3108 domain-containing protein [Tannerellaceae bacterium]